MATSSITANFYTDDPKAANAIVRALFTDVPSTVRCPVERQYVVMQHTPAQERAFFKRLQKKYGSCQKV